MVSYVSMQGLESGFEKKVEVESKGSESEASEVDVKCRSVNKDSGGGRDEGEGKEEDRFRSTLLSVERVLLIVGDGMKTDVGGECDRAAISCERLTCDT